MFVISVSNTCDKHVLKSKFVGIFLDEKLSNSLYVCYFNGNFIFDYS
jgi:hypothetical protein